MTRANSRGIQRTVLDHYDGSKSSMKKLINPSKWAIEDITWWMNIRLKDCSMSLRSVPVTETVRLATDVSDLAIGSVLSGVVFYEELGIYDKK